MLGRLSEAPRGPFNWLLFVFCALALAAPAAAEPDHRCISAEVGAPVVLPDGARHPAGDIRICLAQKYSPVAGLHDTRIDGRQIGVYSSRAGLNEERGEGLRPYLLFRRQTNGDLILQGYAVPDSGRMRTYLLAHPDRS